MREQRIAIYIRLSHADEDTGRKKNESNSVVNQRGLIHRFLDNHAELSRVPRTEFVDDGFTGTNMNRPAFQRMVTAIREGKYSCCITKDFSRFSRDYIEMGDYLECLFPFLGVRYISINDGYDSREYQGTTGGLDMVMRAIIYDAYSKDLSVKVKTAHLQSMKKGRRVRGDPGFGYRRDPERKGMDVIDPVAAAIVRRIFDSAIEGITVGEIALMLNREGIPTPGVYFCQTHPGTRKYTGKAERQNWTHGMVVSILRRYAYTGALVGGMREQIAPCKKSCVRKKPEEWVIVPGVHEAIVTPEEYALAQKVISEKRIVAGNSPPYPLKSLMVCGNCLRHLDRYRRTTRFHCRYGRHEGDEGCRSIKSPKEKTIEKAVFQAIQDYMQLADTRKGEWKQQTRELRQSVASGHADIEKLKQGVESLKCRKFRAYNRYSSGGMSREDYLQRKKEIDEEIARIEAEIVSKKHQCETIEANENAVNSELTAMCETFRGEESLTYDMAHAFVDRILVYPNERIEVQWRFRDCFREIEGE